MRFNSKTFRSALGRFDGRGLFLCLEGERYAAGTVEVNRDGVRDDRDNPGMAVLPPIRTVLSPNRSRRNPATPVDLVVVHRPVGGYVSAITTLCDPTREASAHVILGRPTFGSLLEVTQLVPWGEKAWACSAFNGRSDNLEIADGAWNGRDKEAWLVAARMVAYRLKRRGLRPRWARGGRGRGFCRHYDLGISGGGHTDPTTSTVQWLRFVARVKWEYRRGQFLDQWGIDKA